MTNIMTNIEKMRHMSDKELGKFFAKILNIDTIDANSLARILFYIIKCWDCPLENKCEQKSGTCLEKLEAWLNSEAEE